MVVEKPLNTNTVQNTESVKKDQIIFTYNGIDYDASNYVDQHPGGRDFIVNMKD